jgi:uncharacterized protein
VDATKSMSPRHRRHRALRFFQSRLGQSDLDELDAWRARQSDVPSRSEAVRRLMEPGLAADRKQDKREIRLGDGEKLIILMLCDLFKKLKLNSDIEPEFVEEVIYGGHYWALDWKYPGIFHGHEDSMAVLHETVNILDMWSFLEDGYSKLSKKEKDRVAAEAEPFGKHVVFRGFDGNGEAEYIGIARFLVEQLDRFTKIHRAGAQCAHANRRSSPTHAGCLRANPAHHDGPGSQR